MARFKDGPYIAPVTIVRTFEAKLAGRCKGECGERIEPGQMIHVLSTNKFVHMGCAPSEQEAS